MPKISCSRCGAYLGEEVEIDHVPLFRSGVLFARVIHGACGQCGHVFHWLTSDAKLNRILERLNEKNDPDISADDTGMYTDPATRARISRANANG